MGKIASAACVSHLARGKDVVAILSTGFGKSLIFQPFLRLAKAALKSEMCSIVVSPLVSVTRSQCLDSLRQQLDSAKNTRKTQWGW